jgi:hypothetical protein
VLNRLSVIETIQKVNDNAPARQAGIDKAKAASVYAGRRKDWSFKLFKRLVYQKKWYPLQPSKITYKKLGLSKQQYLRLVEKQYDYENFVLAKWKEHIYL